MFGMDRPRKERAMHKNAEGSTDPPYTPQISPLPELNLDVIYLIGAHSSTDTLFMMCMASKSLKESLQRFIRSIKTAVPMANALQFKNIQTLCIPVAGLAFDYGQGALNNLPYLTDLTISYPPDAIEIPTFFASSTFLANLRALRLQSVALLSITPTFQVPMPKLSTFMIHRPIEGVVALVKSKSNFPALQILGAECSTISDSSDEAMIDLTQSRPEVTLLSHNGETLWMAAVASPHMRLFRSLPTLAKRFPGHPSFDINATPPNSLGSALGVALSGDSFLAHRLVPELIEHGADIFQRFYPVKRLKHLKPFMFKNLPISSFVYAMQNDNFEMAWRLKAEFLSKYSNVPASKWVAEEPLHPIIAACSLQRTELLDALLQQFGDQWGLFDPVDAPIRGPPSLPSCVPLLICCFFDASKECTSYLFDFVSKDHDRFVQLLNDPIPTAAGGTWFHLIAANARYEVLELFLVLDGIDTKSLDAQGGSVVDKVLLRHGKIPETLPFDPQTYWNALESNDDGSDPLIEAWRNVLTFSKSPRPVIDRIHRFLLEKNVLELCLKKHSYRFHSVALKIMIREPSNAPNVDGSLLFSTEQLNKLARAIISKPDFYRDHAMQFSLAVLIEAGCNYFLHQEFIDIVWSKWSHKQRKDQTEVFELLPPNSSLIPSGKITLFDIAESWYASSQISYYLDAQGSTSYRAALQLMERQAADPEYVDDTWSAAFEHMFPVEGGDGTQFLWNLTEKKMTGPARQVFSRFLERVKLPSKTEELYLRIAIMQEIPPQQLRRLLEGVIQEKKYPDMAQVMWQILMNKSCADGEIYISWAADVLIELGLQVAAPLSFNPTSSPTAVRKYIAAFGEPPCSISNCLTKLNWSASNNYPKVKGVVSKDPWSLLYREILRIRRKEDGQFLFRDKNFKLELLESLLSSSWFDDPTDRLIVTLIRSGVFEDLDRVPDDCRASLLFESPHLSSLLRSRGENVRPSDVKPHDIHITLNEALEEQDQAVSWNASSSFAPSAAPTSTLFGSSSLAASSPFVAGNPFGSASETAAPQLPPTAASPFGAATPVSFAAAAFAVNGSSTAEPPNPFTSSAPSSSALSASPFSTGQAGDEMPFVVSFDPQAQSHAFSALGTSQSPPSKSTFSSAKSRGGTKSWKGKK